MKRKWLLCVLLCFSLLLCSCGIGDGGTQFTQIDSQYLESEKASQSEEPLQESMVDSEGKKLETQEVEASQEKSDFESETEKSTGRGVSKNKILE